MGVNRGIQKRCDCKWGASSGWQWKISNGSFPLTPALSLGEREKFDHVFRQPVTSGSIQRAAIRRFVTESNCIAGSAVAPHF
jgi:hypothetical protein